MNQAERKFQDQLTDSLELAAEENGEHIRVVDFGSAGVLTNNAGVVVQLENGDEFQLTIVQSERGTA